MIRNLKRKVAKTKNEPTFDGNMFKVVSKLIQHPIFLKSLKSRDNSLVKDGRLYWEVEYPGSITSGFCVIDPATNQVHLVYSHDEPLTARNRLSPKRPAENKLAKEVGSEVYTFGRWFLENSKAVIVR
ncbi:TPA: hypothetical protein DIU27_02665 [Candidatus Collierbacteria bacterium]|uniref:Uncharacterized protein n=1 Tax=Candidatus Collierbacteria bacterium GW2011_GWB2_44_22 TaxID=1618387 RepID=A0A0G1HXY7_9BACT|nr:MAG: hypothetical protein UW31_C0017G0001 [Candidatus Collierbacteria bacterium GW2011_GWA2_44_13]KKT51805.1 MAG: hypothetical protein UW44_C0008G0127 [Candidatus Collierbacteria bacterium GW2011_GWB2_44_22]KKT61931.1 MAG: hypothetical protein UW56_C0015G0025 [Candidatus Collierbacteria bacterium GW2011_GWD1_44_27]KKT65781.1 MAG: hypothetical protein UW58_C0019G0001 [Candidatus Collierbacteria bacterium GW2011_GWC2_44_30]KKT88088.1 MAG: hypothetical protein UW88_C0015G0001 [Candidatus Collie